MAELKRAYCPKCLLLRSVEETRKGKCQCGAPLETISHVAPLRKPTLKDIALYNLWLQEHNV